VWGTPFGCMRGRAPVLCRSRLEAMLREACVESKYIHARQGMYAPARECTCPPGNVRARQGMYVPAREYREKSDGWGWAGQKSGPVFPGGHVHSLAGIISGGNRSYRISREGPTTACADHASRQCSARPALSLNASLGRTNFTDMEPLLVSCARRSPPGRTRARAARVTTVQYWYVLGITGRLRLRLAPRRLCCNAYASRCGAFAATV
jgi:hypothetical protein